jgi:recombination protein RecA
MQKRKTRHKKGTYMAKDTLTALWKEYEDYLESGDNDQSKRMRFPSGILGLDMAIGSLDGMTRGIVELLGGEAVGKTTLALTILAESQRTRKLKEIKSPNGSVYNAVYLDFEHSYDAVYAASLGVDTKKMLVLNMVYAQDQFKMLELLLDAGIQFVIIDSISVIIPKSEEEKDVTDNVKMADEATVIGRAMKRANALAAASDSLILVINQYRANTSQMARTDKKAYGAWLLRYLKKVTIELTRVERQDTRMVIEAFVSKNKMGAIGKKIRYEIEHGKGIDIDQHILRIAKEYDVVQEKGKGRWEYEDLKAHGEKKALAAFPMQEIKAKVIEALKAVRIEDESITEDE